MPASQSVTRLTEIAGASLAMTERPMLKLTRLDRHVIAINPDHIAWVDATPDTTICLVGDRKIIVRESLDEVVELFIDIQKRFGRSMAGALNPAPREATDGEH